MNMRSLSYRQITCAGFFVDVDLTGNLLGKKIVKSCLKEVYSYILVVGGREEVCHCVNVRSRGNKVLGMSNIDELIDHLTAASLLKIEPFLTQFPVHNCSVCNLSRCVQ